MNYESVFCQYIIKCASIKDFSFAEKLIIAFLQKLGGGSALIINALPPKFLQNASPTFSMVHLLHHLYGVDTPDAIHG